MPVLPDSVIRLLTCGDYRRRLALVAELETTDGTEVVALGSFAAIDEHRVEVGDIISSRTRHGVSELTFAPRQRS
jgi:hypothetical protein